tara:strand:+ start:254 stop:808 length:555 start_codon:yes stop_codon:yes gene_type:complete
MNEIKPQRMKVSEAIAEVQQTRSRFQIENFVLKQHDTIEMQFYQLCLEMQTMRHALAINEVAIRKSKLEIKRLLKTGDEMDALEAESKQIDLDYLMVTFNGSLKEYAIMEDLFDQMPHFTRDEIEHAQPEYWTARMSRQTQLQIMAGGVQWSQLDAMRQIGLLDELIEEQNNQIETATKAQLPK